MIKKTLVFTSLCFSSLLVAKDRDYKGEADGLAKQFQKIIGDFFGEGGDSEGLSPEKKEMMHTVLPEKDKGKTFQAPQEGEQAPCPFEQEIVAAIESTHSFEDIDPDAEFFQEAQQPGGQIPSLEGLTARINHDGETPFTLETCIEANPKILSFEEHEKIEHIPAKKERRLFCHGHDQSRKCDKLAAYNLKGMWQAAFERDSSLSYYKTEVCDGKYFSSYKARAEWRHHDGIRCDRNGSRTVVVAPAKIEKKWELQDEELFNYVENSPDCEYISTSFPTADRKKLLYRCGPKDDGSCQRLRDLGARFVEKTCLERDPNGHCLSYKKTYKVPQAAAIPEVTYSFEKEKNAIWGLNELQAPSTPYPDYKKPLAQLYAVSAISDHAPGNFQGGNVQIFPGKAKRCTTHILGRGVQDCCGLPHRDKNEIGVAIDLGIVGCSQEEKELFAARRDKKCLFIGKRWKKLHTESERTYLCFDDLLPRIIREAAKDQLGLDYGTPEEPHTDGLTLQQLQHLNFEAIDFSDFTQVLEKRISQQEVRKTIKTRVATFDSPQAGSHTQNLLTEQKNAVESFEGSCAAHATEAVLQRKAPK